MLLKAILFGLALLICLLVFSRIRSRSARQGMLLVTSYTLYFTWAGWFVFVLLASTAMNFVIGEWLRKKPHWLVLLTGVLFNLALLSSFKYLPQAAITVPISSLQRFSHLGLPLGISFWTFEAMSYLFDLYRGEELNPSLFEFALYMAFFPVVISGPICRMPDMLPQFRSEQALLWSEVGHGFRRIATGVLMMQLGRLLGQGILAGDGINSGFDRLTRWSGTDVWCLAFGYGLQLFFDFAGYSHIAIGAAKVLGFIVPENFARPFQSTSPSIFWTRWHMSLSFWIRDYVFFPLAVLRRDVWWRNLALVIAMIVFGVWHKATLLFVLWGGYHGVLLVLHRQLQQVQRRFDWTPPAVWAPLSWLLTISLISVGWIFFRATSVAQANQMLSALLTPASYQTHFLTGSLYVLVLGLSVGYMIVILTIDALDRFSSEAEATNLFTAIIARIARWRWFWIPALYTVTLILVSIVTFTRGTAAAQLMYGVF